MQITYQDDNSAEVEIPFNYYDYPSIIEAAKEFTESCWVAIQGADDGMSLFVRFEPKESDIDVKDAIRSFFNYVLGIMHGKIKDAEAML